METPKKLDESFVEVWNEPERLPEMLEWLKVERNEAILSQYALIILKKHLERENLTLKTVKTAPLFWSVFSVELYANIKELVEENSHKVMLNELFAELVAFCEAAFLQYFAYHLKVILEFYLDKFEENSKIEKYLPQKAVENLHKIRNQMRLDYEANLERQIEMGY
ncbi:MAG TPA: hypothetical protein PKY59_02625 [Pyrinomonadaceae bacterium]|nr:hypothetical protein [Pyrinomonadaceae bacterium]